MTDDELARDVAKALADRRTAPSRDLEPRLLRATMQPPRRSTLPIVLAATVAVLVIVVGVFGLTRPDDTRDPVSAPSLPAGPTAPQPSRPTVTEPSDPLVIYQTVLDGTDKLQLTTAQRSQLRDLSDELAKQRAALGSQREIAMIELRRETDKASPDPKRATALLARVSDADAALRKAEIEARLAARALLTADQRTQLTAPAVATVPRPPATPPRATLTVESSPAGATVQIDGKDVGRTPLRLAVATGRHTVEVTHPGYQAHQIAADVAEDTKLRVSLVKDGAPVPSATTGILRVNSKPYSKVYVDGKDVGYTPIRSTLAPGRHAVKLVTDDGRSQSRVVVIEPSKVTMTVIDFGD